MWSCLFATGTSCAAIWRPRSIDPILHLWHSSFCLSGFLVTSPAVLFIWFSEFFIFNASGLFCFAFQKSLFPCWVFCVADIFACIADLLHSADFFFFLFADVPLYGLIKFICLFLSSFRLLIIFYQKTEIVTLHFAYLYIFGFSIHGVTISCKSHAADFLKFLMFAVVSASLGLDIWIFFWGGGPSYLVTYSFSLGPRYQSRREQNSIPTITSKHTRHRSVIATNTSPVTMGREWYYFRMCYKVRNKWDTGRGGERWEK